MCKRDGRLENQNIQGDPKQWEEEIRSGEEQQADRAHGRKGVHTGRSVKTHKQEIEHR